LDASAEARPDEHISAREALRKKPVAAKPKSVDVKVKRGKDLDVVEVPREQPSEPTAMNDVGRLGSH
jgi:hypothetical protein